MVLGLVADTGLRGWDAGQIENAVVVEGMTSVLIGLNIQHKVKRPGSASRVSLIWIKYDTDINTAARIPLVRPGDDLPTMINAALAETNLTLQDGDILVLAQKIVSKAEGRLVNLTTVKPGERAMVTPRSPEKTHGYWS